MRVFWTIDAENDLINTFNYLKFKHNEAFADKVIDKIFNKSFLLENFPEMGAVEKSKMLENLEIRYLVEGNYKILYQINNSKGLVEILAVFDTRRDPSKMLSKEE
jgi:plasmid stabilization system protein ParE